LTKYLLGLGVILLIVLRQDFWNWDDNSLYFGFLPVGLAYQMLISIGATILPALACKYAWPKDAE